MNVIRVENLVKEYRIYDSPLDRLKEILSKKPRHLPFVALNDLTFSVAAGETLGIIGENGAGKSTLLKILAKTLKPTRGDVATRGLPAAILELGAGFNPELSGKENIFLNAFLLGLSKEDVSRKKDGIIAFSELGEFIFRPVKTYSSGMVMRLAFSIAACIDPDILIIDEALSVGDEHFQKKCIDKIVSFKKEKKTILFCSHSLYRVQELCDRTLWLKAGGIEALGDNRTVIAAYEDYMRGKNAAASPPQAETAGNGNGPVRIETVRILDSHGRESAGFRSGEPLRLEITVRTREPGLTCRGHVAAGLFRNDDIHVANIGTKTDGRPPFEFRDGRRIRLDFPSVSILSGEFYFLAVAGDDLGLLAFDKKRSDFFHIENARHEFGLIDIEHRWEIIEPEKQGLEP